MKDLDAINPLVARPSSFVSVCALLPLLISACGLAFAYGAAESVPLQSNPVFVLCVFVMMLSCALLFVPRIFKWDWRARYFGLGTMYMASVAMLGGVPWLCILIYGAPSILLRLVLFLLYISLLVWWSFRFFAIYNSIYSDTKMRSRIYQEDVDCFYYLQKGDTALLDKVLRFKQFPPGTLFVLCGVLACLAMAFGHPLVAFFRLPFAHLFLAIGAVPLDMMAVGLAVRGWMIFYRLPSKLRRETGKQVYVDMVSKPK